ncbi:zinc finger, CCHC-type containing protein [Tanacetum coccineum]
MKYEFVALAAAGKEAERLRNLILEFPLCSKPIAPISIRCDSAATLSVGIIHETTALYTPQQNDISQKKNRVLKEITNSMLSYSGLSQGFWGETMAVVRLPDSKLKTLAERGIKFIFVGYAEHSKAFRSLINATEDIGGSVVPQKVTEEVVVVQQPEPKLRKSKRNRTLKNFAPKFQLYLIDGTRDEVSDEHSYCFNVEDDPKTVNEAVKSQDVDLRKEFRSSRFSMKDMGEADVILVSTPMDTSEKMMPNNGQAISQLEYYRVIGCLMYAMTCTRPDIAFAVAILKYNSSISGCVFLLGGGVISWASKKQTCITSSIMESEFVALAAAN